MKKTKKIIVSSIFATIMLVLVSTVSANQTISNKTVPYIETKASPVKKNITASDPGGLTNNSPFGRIRRPILFCFYMSVFGVRSLRMLLWYYLAGVQWNKGIEGSDRPLAFKRYQQMEAKLENWWYLGYEISDKMDWNWPL